MKRIFVVLVGVVVVFFAAFTLFSFQKSSPDVASGTSYDSQQDRQYWLGQLAESPAADVYTSFLADNRGAPIGVQHVRAHVIGEALFDTLGIKGIAICDSSFGFGCFHGLFTIGFASEGESFVEEADAFCVEKYGILGTGCQHGIGHGIVEYVGRKNLAGALSLCERTSQPTPLLGCTSGVFMEHNTPFTVIPGVEPLPPYPYSEKHPYSRCEEIPEKYKESCYYELGGWWEVVLSGDKKKMGENCNAIEDKVYREACALGVGNITGPTMNYSTERSADVCDMLPERIRTLCYAGAAWSMYANPEFMYRADSLCNRLSEKVNRNKCMSLYNLADQKY